jgi:hypothetical protein
MSTNWFNLDDQYIMKVDDFGNLSVMYKNMNRNIIYDGTISDYNQHEIVELLTSMAKEIWNLRQRVDDLAK